MRCCPQPDHRFHQVTVCHTSATKVHFSEMGRILTVELKGEVGERWSDAEGVYSICPSLINGKPWWQQASNALWYDKTFQNWKIGDTGDHGGSDCKMFTLRNTARDPPHIATPWKYMINGECMYINLKG